MTTEQRIAQLERVLPNLLARIERVERIIAGVVNALMRAERAIRKKAKR